MPAVPMTPEQRKSFAEDCVRLGISFRIEPHYLLAVAQFRSELTNGNDGTRIGVYRLEQAEWDANIKNQEFEGFTAENIASARRQVNVYAFMAHKAFDAFVAAKGKNPSAKELYLQQWPNDVPPDFDTKFKAAFEQTAAMVDPAADALLDGPDVVSPITNPDVATTGPFKKVDSEAIQPQGGPGLLTLEMLRRQWPTAPAALIQGMADTSDVLSAVGINTPLRMAHFMAQISHECGKGKTVEENLNYTTSAAMQRAFGKKRFPDEASTLPFLRNREALGNKVYSGRMGNTEPGDGFKFRGRGCIQITGRDNYTAIGKSRGLPLLDNPDLAMDPQHVLTTGGAMFVKLRCLPECDKDDVARVSAAINLGNPGGDPNRINGLPDRRDQLAIWKREFGVA